MSMSPGSFRPDEISDAGRSGPDTDLTEALAAARILEQAIPTDDLQPSAGFASRVMAAVASDPPPRAAGFLVGMWARPGLVSLVASVRQAWATASRGAGRPFGARAAALAYVFVVLLAAASIAGVAAIGTAGAFGLFSIDGSPTPSIVVASPRPSPSPVLPDGVIPMGSHEPSPSDQTAPSASPDGSPGSGPTKKPSATPMSGGSQAPVPSGASGAPSPTSSDDAHASASPRPSRSPKPSETP